MNGKPEGGDFSRWLMREDEVISEGGGLVKKIQIHIGLELHLMLSNTKLWPFC